MLTVGVDSYVTLEEAEEIISGSLLSTDEANKSWQGLSDSDKEVLLRTSCRDIDNLKFSGRRKNLGQRLEFPRTTSTVAGIGYRLFIGQFQDNGLYSGGTADGGIHLVKQAQVINAAYAGLFNKEATDLVKSSIQGLTSKKAGPIAETYNRNGQDTKDALIGIYTQKVYSLLTPWLGGSRYTI